MPHARLIGQSTHTLQVTLPPGTTSQRLAGDEDGLVEHEPQGLFGRVWLEEGRERRRAFGQHLPQAGAHRRSASRARHPRVEFHRLWQALLVDELKPPALEEL